MIESQDLEQLPENLHLALLAVNYSLFNFDLYGFCITMPLTVFCIPCLPFSFFTCFC